MALDASLDAALRGAAPLVCLLLKIELPDHTIRLVDGAGEVVFGAETYAGEDEVYGVLDAVEPMTEQVGTEAPTVRFTFLPASLDALADITDPANQGAPVYVWFGAVDPATGLIVGEPELLFLGELDTAEVESGETATVISFDVVSAWERLFEANEGRRLNDKYWQSIYPGARGMQYVTEMQRDLPWGYDAPRPRVVSDTVGGRTGGGGGGGSPVVGGGGGRGGGWSRGRARMSSVLVRRVEAVEATIARFKDKPLKLGTDDCVRMAAFALRKGVRASLLKAGSYSSEVGARRVMKKLGYDTLADAVDALGLPRIAPAMALPGDILTLKAATEEDTVSLAVAVGNGRVLGFWAAVGVCTVFQPLEYDAAWRSI